MDRSLTDPSVCSFCRIFVYNFQKNQKPREPHQPRNQKTKVATTSLLHYLVVCFLKMNLKGKGAQLEDGFDVFVCSCLEDEEFRQKGFAVPC